MIPFSFLALQKLNVCSGQLLFGLPSGSQQLCNFFQQRGGALLIVTNGTPALFCLAFHPSACVFIKAVWDAFDHGYLFDPRHLLTYVYECKYFNNFSFFNCIFIKIIRYQNSWFGTHCVLVLLVTFAVVWWAHFFLFCFMAIIPTQPRFPSSDPTDLNFCQGDGSFLLVLVNTFYSVPFSSLFYCFKSGSFVMNWIKT